MSKSLMQTSPAISKKEWAATPYYETCDQQGLAGQAPPL